VTAQKQYLDYSSSATVRVQVFAAVPPRIIGAAEASASPGGATESLAAFYAMQEATREAVRVSLARASLTRTR